MFEQLPRRQQYAQTFFLGETADEQGVLTASRFGARIGMNEVGLHGNEV